MALALDGRGYLDMGDIAAFGFYDRFTISAWIKPGEPRRGTIVSRMVDEPQGEGYQVALEDGKVHVNLVSRWLDDAIRVETVPTVPSEKWTHLPVTYDGSRLAAGVKVYLDGSLVPLRVALDELNQSFQTKAASPDRAGGGPASRFDAIDELCVFKTALAVEDVSILATAESISEILQIAPRSRTIGQVRKVRGCFLQTGAPPPVRRSAP